MDLELLKPVAAKLTPYAVSLRREIHSHPELSGQETGTVALICRELDRLGIAHEVLHEMNAVVGVIDTDREGSVVALRADMDALPIQEQTDLPFKSQNPGVMHACGHDVHTAILLGTAAVLQNQRTALRGKIKLFFQPAEEGNGGAQVMISAGCMENPHVDAVFGLHCSPRYPAGKVSTCAGHVNANSDECSIVVRGKTSHGASPEDGVDAIYIACQLVNALHGLSSRRVCATDAISLNVGTFVAGQANNIICDRVDLGVMFRTIRQDTRARIKEEIKVLAEGMCRSMGGSAEVTFTPGYDSQENDVVLTERFVELCGELLPEDSFVLREHPDLGTEDFCYFGQKAPSLFYDLGTGTLNGHPNRPLHSCEFTVDEASLYYGILLQSALVADYLARH